MTVDLVNVTRRNPRLTARRHYLHAMLIATIMLAAACVPESEDPRDVDNVRVQRSEIVGGTVDRGDSAVVGLTTGGSVCSGTLIAPNLVLTAQHCVAQVSAQYVQCGRSAFGSTYPAGRIYATTYHDLQQAFYQRNNIFQGAQVYVPEGGNDMCGYDIALLVLNRNVPESVAKPIVPRIDIPVQRNEVYTAIGFGHTGDGSGAGIRRTLDGRQVFCGGTSCPSYSSVQPTEFFGSDGTCQGDSGGAAIDEQGRVLGALSRGPDGCRASIYSAVAGWSDWMREIGEIAAEQGGYTAPSWVTYGVSEAPENDLDVDGALDDVDNCPGVSNEDQADNDGDGLGDACDGDSDNDDIADDEDNCPLYENPAQYDTDSDGFGDACDQDDDGDGVADADDPCPLDASVATTDTECTISVQQNGNGNDETIITLGGDPNAQASSGGCSSTGGNGATFPALLLAFGFFFARRRRS